MKQLDPRSLLISNTILTLLYFLFTLWMMLPFDKNPYGLNTFYIPAMFVFALSFVLSFLVLLSNKSVPPIIKTACYLNLAPLMLLLSFPLLAILFLVLGWGGDHGALVVFGLSFLASIIAVGCSIVMFLVGAYRIFRSE